MEKIANGLGRGGILLAALAALLVLATIIVAASPGEAKKSKKGGVKVAAEKLNDSPVNGASGTAVTTTIKAPSSGRLVIDASSDLFNPTTDDFPACFIEIDNVEDTPSRRGMELNGNSNVNEDENCSTNTVVSVNPGKHTVDLEASAGTGTDFQETTLSVIFIPGPLP